MGQPDRFLLKLLQLLRLLDQLRKALLRAAQMFLALREEPLLLYALKLACQTEKQELSFTALVEMLYLMDALP